MRSWDAKLVDEAVAKFTSGRHKDFDAIEWVADQSNILLQEGDDYAIFEHERPRIVTGHYYFTSRGRAAITVAEEFIREVFNTGVQVIRGMTPLTNLGARWMSRHLGFTSHGVVNTLSGPHELFIMHHSEFSK